MSTQRRRRIYDGGKAKFAHWVDLHGCITVFYPCLPSIVKLLRGEICGSPRLAKIEDNTVRFYAKTF